MKISVYIPTLFVALVGCKIQPVFDLPKSRLDLAEIVKWNNEYYFSEGVASLYKLQGDSLTEFKEDSIIDIKQCSEQVHLLKAPNDSTLIIVYPDGSEKVVKNKTDLMSKYFKIHLNEQCRILLEYGTAFFKLQEDQFIDYNMVYGFKENQSPNGSDMVGFFDNFVFLTKYPGHFSGGLFKFYLDSLHTYNLPTDTKIRDFKIHDDKLLIVNGYHETIGDEELMESRLVSLYNGQVTEMPTAISKNYDISRIYSDGQNIFFLSEKLGFFKVTNNKPELLISINLRESNIAPESFVVDNGKIYLTTWEHGLLIFEGQNDQYDLKQIK